MGGAWKWYIGGFGVRRGNKRQMGRGKEGSRE